MNFKNKKLVGIVITTIILLTLLIISCDYKYMNEDQEEKYYTVTYHKDEGTTGEPPVE